MIGSLDVESLYPSLNIDRCVEVIKQKLFLSRMEFSNLQWKEIALYLRYNMDEREIQQSAFRDILPSRRYKRRPPLFTRSGSCNIKKIRHQPWIFHQQRDPDRYMVRDMYCEAVGIMIKRTMELHDFRIDSEIYRQSKGGAIGMDLTGVVSDIYMCE